MNRGFSHFYGHLNGAIDYFDLTREGELDWHNDWETCHDKGYSTELITKEAIRCIDAYEKEGPFMLYVAYNAPHTPLQAQEKDIKLYTDNFDSLTPKEQKKVTYSAMVSCMDRGIGAIVDALKKKGIMDNTFFIFFSDNGTAGVPGAGFIMLTMILTAIGLPLEGSALIAGIDRILDMPRTCVNVTGDATVAYLVDKSEKSNIEEPLY